MKAITAQEVEQLVKKQEQIHILDVREVEEVKTGKIPDALNIPLPLLEFRMHELDKAKKLYCCLSVWWQKRYGSSCS